MRDRCEAGRHWGKAPRAKFCAKYANPSVHQKPCAHLCGVHIKQTGDARRLVAECPLFDPPDWVCPRCGSREYSTRNHGTFNTLYCNAAKRGCGYSFDFAATESDIRWSLGRSLAELKRGDR